MRTNIVKQVIELESNLGPIVSPNSINYELLEKTDSSKPSKDIFRHLQVCSSIRLCIMYVTKDFMSSFIHTVNYEYLFKLEMF